MWHRCKNNCAFLPSRLARALWIEMAFRPQTRQPIEVEARESLVDRNPGFQVTSLKFITVEARESLVDRNCLQLCLYPGF